MAGDPGKVNTATKCSVQQWRHAFLFMLQDILNDMELDPKPFNMEFFLQVQENLLIELSANNLTGINAEREQVPAKIAHFTRSSTGKGINLSLAKLEERIALLEAPNGHLHARKRLPGQGGYKGVVCLVCNSTEHPTHKCSKANKQAVLAYEKAQQAKGRNQPRSLRRLAGDNLVSNGESEHEGSDAGSVKAKPYFVSTLHHSKSAMRNSLSITRAPLLSVTFNTTATVREYTPACWQPNPLPENWARLVLKWSIFTNRRFRKRILRTCLALFLCN